MEIETQCLYAGYSPRNGEPQTLPICQSTTFKYESTEQVSKLFDLEEAGFFYTRLGNPTVDAVEQKIATLEGGVGALCTASGQAATTFSIPMNYPLPDFPYEHLPLRIPSNKSCP